MTGRERTRASSLVNDGIFAATGVGLVLPGAMLPALLARWSLTDARAGLLFFVFFLGSMSGAVLARGSLERSIARGCLLAALGLAALGWCSGVAAFAAMLLFGVGLGVMMTSISLLESRTHPQRRVSRLARLNFLWAVGACCGPWIGLHGSARWGVSTVLFAMAAAFVVGGTCALQFVEHVRAAERVAGVAWWREAMLAPLLLLLVVPLSTGVESTVGGWLATYARRSGATLGGTIGAATWFWAGMLLARLLQSHAGLARRSERALLRWCPWVMVAGLVAVMTSGGSMLLPWGALMLGLGAGPMYPLALAWVLERGEGGNAVFLVAGVGSSLLPLLTGLVSSGTGSLRAGLTVPLCAAVVLGVTGSVLLQRQRE